ncbi:MAG: ABC transporter permease [Bacteroidales bacterium]|nr:ABC transporter permease [Bacteroidales bacterium]MDD3664439.1 ABC transporter permease [Bacteroidales bacterium]
MILFRSGLKASFRIIFRNKAFAFINIAGLTLGFATAMFIGLWILDELSYDTHLKESRQVYRIYFESPDVRQPRTPHPLAQTLVKEVAGVEAAVSLSPIWNSGLTKAEFIIKVDDKTFIEDKVMSADSTFFDVFPFRLIAGNPLNALKIPLGVVVTKHAAGKYFGTSDVLGRTMKVNNEITLTVTGVMEDIPVNTHFQFDLLVSYVTLKQGQTGNYYTWADFGHYNYIKISPTADPKAVEKAIAPCVMRHVTLSAAEKRIVESGQVRLAIQPVRSIHLHSDLIWELGNNGSILYVWIFAGAAILLLIIASINFTNLSAARAMQRARETGLRKTFGSTRQQLIKQFLGEALLMTSLTVVLSLILTETLLPVFNHFTDKTISTFIFYNPFILPSVVVLGLIVGLAAGSYPAFILASFSPSAVLKGYESGIPSQAWVRKGLLIFQFGMSAFLLTGMAIINNQLTYLQNANTGFSREKLMVVPLKTDKMKAAYPEFRKKLLTHAAITDVGASTNIPGKQFNINAVGTSIESSFAFSEMWVDEHFLKVLGVKINEGQFIARDPGADTVNHFLINEAGARTLNLQNPIGQSIIYFGDENQNLKGEVSGIISDFNFQSLHQSISPLIVLQRKGGFNFMLIRFGSTSPANIVATVETIYREFEQELPFTWYFLEQEYFKQYTHETRMSDLFLVFAIVALTIALIGLLALTAYQLEQQRRSIGIKKVLGATTSQIVKFNLQRYMVWVVAGNLISIAPVWWVMNNWLSRFAYRIAFPWEVFLFSLFITLLATLITILFQTYRAANANPVKALKYE